MSSHRDDSRRHSSSSRRDNSPSRHRRRTSPGPSRGRSPPPRSDRSLPEQFGRTEETKLDDDLNVLQRMKKSYIQNPLGCLTKCLSTSRKLKVWTRNYKEVRGICTGYITAFDKHWNLVLTDVDEVYLKPRKSKTPFLSDMKSGEKLPELEPKVPKKKKDAAKEVEEVQITSEDEPSKKAEEKEGTVEGGKKKKKRRKKKKNTPQPANRQIKQCFVRGDNIVMVAIVAETQQSDEEEEEEEEESSETTSRAKETK